MRISSVLLFFSHGGFVRRDCNRRVNLNTVELEALVQEVKTHSVKQRNKMGRN